MPNRLPFVFILITVVIDAMGIGLIMSIMPTLIREVHVCDLGNAAVWGGLLATSFAVMQFLFGPTIGSISDRFGRRPVLLIALFVMSLDYLVMALAGTIWLLLAGRIIGGITAATQSTASAYVADLSKPAEKAANFGLIGAAFGVGFVLGPLIGGILAGFGTRAPFYAAAALAFANLTFGYVVLPETVTDRIRRPFRWARANPLGAFAQIGALPEVGRLLLTAFGSIAGPAMQGIMSRRAADNQQGELQGTLSSVNAVGTIVAPLLMTQTFWFFTTDTAPLYLPGAPFLLSAALIILCLGIFVSRPRRQVSV